MLEELLNPFSYKETKPVSRIKINNNRVEIDYYSFKTYKFTIWQRLFSSIWDRCEIINKENLKLFHEGIQVAEREHLLPCHPPCKWNYGTIGRII